MILKRSLIAGVVLALGVIPLTACGSQQARTETRGASQSIAFGTGQSGWSELPRPPASPSGPLVWADDRVFFAVGAEVGEHPGLWYLRPSDQSWTNSGLLPFGLPIMHPTIAKSDGTVLLGATTCDGKFSDDSGCEGTLRYELAKYDTASDSWTDPHTIESVFSDRTIAMKGPESVALLGYSNGEAQVLDFNQGLTGRVRHVNVDTGAIISDESLSYPPGTSSCYMGATRLDLVPHSNDLVTPVTSTDSSGAGSGFDIRMQTSHDNPDTLPNLVSATLANVVSAGATRAHVACGAKKAAIITSTGEGAAPVSIDPAGTISTPDALLAIHGFPVSENPVLVLSDDPTDHAAFVLSNELDSYVEVPGSQFYNAIGTGNGVVSIGMGADNQVRAFFLNPMDATSQSNPLPDGVLSDPLPRKK